MFSLRELPFRSVPLAFPSLRLGWERMVPLDVRYRGYKRRTFHHTSGYSGVRFFHFT